MQTVTGARGTLRRCRSLTPVLQSSGLVLAEVYAEQCIEKERDCLEFNVCSSTVLLHVQRELSTLGTVRACDFHQA